MFNWLPAVTPDTVWQVLRWLGGSAVLAFLAWLLKLPQKAWRRAERWVVFKHEGIPRRPLLISVRGAQWHFGAIAKEPATQFHIQLTVTNVATGLNIEIISVVFRQAWTARRRSVVNGMITVGSGGRAFTQGVAAKSVAEVILDGFVVPRIEWENKPINGVLYLVDQFHNRYSVAIRIMPGGDVPSGASESSLALIQASLAETARALAVPNGYDWSKQFYQYANRLAHAYFLAEVNGIPTKLVFLYFIGDSDVNGPAVRADWETAIQTVHAALGLSTVPSFVQDVFVDVRTELQPFH